LHNLQVEDKLKIAQFFALRSFKLAFLNVGSFLEKGEVYLATVRVLHRTKNIRLIQHIERSMLTVISTKFNWTDVEELVMVANVYLTMYQIRYNLTLPNFYRRNLHSKLIYLNMRKQSVEG